MIDKIIRSASGNSLRLEFLIDELPLMPGKYDLTIFIEVNGEISDWIQNAISIDVEPGDYYNTGKLIPQGQGTFLMNYSFKYYESR